MVKMAEMVVMVRMDFQVLLVKMVKMVKMVEMVVMVSQAGMARTVRRERGEILVSKAHLDLPAPAVEGWCTLAGDEQPAPTHQEQSWSMQEGLGGPTTVPKEELPTTSACLRVQTT